MPQLARGYITASELKEIIKQVNALKLPGVVKINCTFGEDWSGDPAISFWVTLTDDASRRRVLGRITSRVEDAIRNTIDPRNKLDVLPNFYFRSQSEQKLLRDKAYG
jgi:hypothetical protein